MQPENVASTANASAANESSQKSTDDLIVALGELINASRTLQSALLGGIEGMERERALTGFDQTLSHASRLREQHFGEPSPLAEIREAPIVEPVAQTDNKKFGSHTFNPMGKT